MPPPNDEDDERLNLEHRSWPDAAGGLLAATGSTPHPRLRLHRGLPSVYLPDQHDLIVYLPPGYDTHPERSYPALYLHDGQNLFDGRTSFIPGRTWQVREHADAAIEAGEVEPLVIVGIYNTGDRRIAEYTHERDWERGGGQADEYGLMLTRELMPWIASEYRVLAGREQTGVGGSSLGGLVSLFLALRHPEVFGRVAALSPSVWWNSKSILGYLNERAPGIWERPRMWVDVGDREG
ncbi:MAG: alpha/beta hydrolase-fold protein, partial [Terracidiphilus sp.]